MLRLYDTAQRKVVPLGTARPGQGVDVRLRAHRLRPAAHRPRPVHAGVRRPPPLPRVDRARRSATSPTSPTSTTRSSKAASRGARPRPRWRPSTRRSGGRPWTRSACCAPPPTRTPPPTSSGWSRPIARLVDAGIAYETVRRRLPRGRPGRRTTGSWPASRSSPCRPAPGSRAATRSGRPLDFALWKKAKPGEPTWESPWGPGRPGWHTECVVMSLDLLGDGFDLHGGGIDLAFPHHENERAQAVALGRPFARHWVHNGFVEVDGEKMSKSLGNFTTLLDLLDVGRPARLPAARAAVPLPVAGRGHQGQHRRRRRRARTARRVRPPHRRPDRLAPSPTRDRRAVPASAWTTTSTRRASSTSCSERFARPTPRSTADDATAAAPLAAAVHAICEAVGLVLDGGGSRVSPRRRRGDGGRDATRPGPPGTGPLADALRDELQAAGGWWRTPRRAPSCADRRSPGLVRPRRGLRAAAAA